MDISIFGMGYVGAVCAACFSREGHRVIGVDANPVKAELLAKGESPIIEKDLPESIQAGVKNGLLTATTDPREAILNSSVSMICVGTPSQVNGSLDLQYVRRVCEQIGEALREKSSFHVIVMRSTVLPRTTSELVIPPISEFSGKQVGKDFGVVFNPEFLREGTAIFDFYNPPKTVIGQTDQASGDVLAELYAMLDAPVFRTRLETAEMIKYADNAWHATKVTFANEIGNISRECGIDGHEVMDIFCKDTKLNLSGYYLKPGFAFGGSCLPKDVRAICYKATSLDLKTPLLSSLLPSNQYQVERALSMVQNLESKKIGFLGLSFKAGTDDLRESPAVELAERLLGKGYEIKIYDRNVSLASLNGANKEFILNKISHISRLLTPEVEDVIKHSDTLVIGNNADEFREVIKQVNGSRDVIDLVRISEQTSEGTYQGICW